MKASLFRTVSLFLAVGAWGVSSSVFAASGSPSLSKAKQEAEAKGFIFETSRDEIIAKARKEGKLRVISSLEGDTTKLMMESFKKKYPFIDGQIEEISGTDAAQRFLLELKAGAVKEWDIANASEDFYNEFAGQAKKFDILGMAEQGVLKINPKMVDPEYRTMVAMSSTVCGIAYNRNRIPPEKVPNQFEDFLKPEFKGRKFLVDIRPHCMVALMPGMGEEWVVSYARKIKEQEPVFVRGNNRALAVIAAGEYALHQLTLYDSCIRVVRKDVTKSLVCKLVEPIPARILDGTLVINTSSRPYAALLWLEHGASPEGQKIIDDFEPIKSNIYADGEVAKLVKGRKVSLNDFKTYHKSTKRLEMVIGAYGFPKAELK